MASIIFDFDGTLGDTNGGIVATTLATLDRMGYPHPSVEAITATIGLPLKDNFLQACKLPEDKIQLAIDTYHEIFDDIAPQMIELFPGVEEVLAALSQRGVPMAIASSRGQRSLDMLCEKLGITKYIPKDHIFGVETAARPKPAPDMVYVIMGRIGSKPEETLVVGDTIYDIEMGKNAGCYTCGVSYGNQSADQLAGASPNYILDDLRKLI